MPSFLSLHGHYHPLVSMELNIYRNSLNYWIIPEVSGKTNLKEKKKTEKREEKRREERIEKRG